MRRCGFCGGPGVTKEHVWPDWLRKVILDSRALGGMKHFHAEIERGGKANRFKISTLEIKVGMPCESCNHGWMSALENQVKPFLTVMTYRGEKTLLDPDRQTWLTRWIIKTAMVYEFTAAAAEANYFSEGERAAFKERFEIPQNVWIWIGRYDGVRPIHAVQRRASSPSDFPPRIYSLTLTANFLAMQVFAFRDSERELSRVAAATKTERLTQLFAPPNAWVTWPPGTTIDDDALAILDDRFVNVLRGE